MAQLKYDLQNLVIFDRHQINFWFNSFKIIPVQSGDKISFEVQLHEISNNACSCNDFKKIENK